MANSFEAGEQFANNYDQIFPKCQEAVYRSGFNLIKSDISSGHIEAKVGMGLRSFGENISIQVDQKGTVVVRSECAISTTMVDWGKNKDNVTKFFDSLSALLIEASSPSVPTSSEVSPSFEILQEFDVQEDTEIVGTEELPLDNQNGSDDLTVEHEFSKTTSSEISVEITQQLQGKIGLDLLKLLKVEVAALLSRQVGYNNGESTTRRYTSRFSVKPGDFVIYTVVWKRKIRSGKYEILAGNQRVVVPFKACFGLEYLVTASSE